MANEMPDPETHTGLSRRVLHYGAAFAELVAARKAGELTDADWAPIERLVDTQAFERQGVFLGPRAERFGWATYRSYIGQYAGATDWEGTLRHITEEKNRVILELEERNTRDGHTDVSNTVTVYEFGEDERLRRLEVYVMPLG